MSGEERNIHVESHGQQGGITAYHVNIQPGDRQLTEIKATKLRSLMDKTNYTSVEVISLMGDAEAERYATQIVNYLASENITVSAGIYGAVIPHGVRVERPGEDGILRVKVGGRS